MTTTGTTQDAGATGTTASGTTGTTTPAGAAPGQAGTTQTAAGGTGTQQQQPGTTAATTTTGTATTEPARVVPDRYTLTIPRGQHGPILDDEDVQAMAALAKARQWTNDEAQEALAETHEQLQAQRARLHEQLVRHAEVGGDHVSAAQQAAMRVLDRFLPATEADGAELRKTLNKTGYGDWAPLVVLLSRVGKAMGEDTVGTRGVTQTQAQSDADFLRSMYDHPSSRT